LQGKGILFLRAYPRAMIVALVLYCFAISILIHVVMLMARGMEVTPSVTFLRIAPNQGKNVDLTPVPLVDRARSSFEATPVL